MFLILLAFIFGTAITATAANIGSGIKCLSHWCLITRPVSPSRSRRIAPSMWRQSTTGTAGIAPVGWALFSKQERGLT